MTLPIGLYLVDFGQQVMPERPTATLDLDDLEPAPSLDEMDTFEPGFEEVGEPEVPGDAAAAEAALLALRGEMAAMEAAHAAQIESTLRQWAEQEGGPLAASIRAGLAELESRLAQTVADLLLPVLSTAVHAKTVDEIKSALGSLIAGGASSLIRVSGPADLLDALKAALGTAPAVEFTETETPEVTVVAGDTTLQSHLGDWAARLDISIRENR